MTPGDAGAPGAAPSTPSGRQYRLGSRDLAVCAGLVLLFCLPFVTQLGREAVIGVAVLATVLGAWAAAILVLPVAVAGYFVARARIPWGWKIAAGVAALLAWILLSKLMLTGQVALSVGSSGSGALVAVAAASLALASFKWGRDRHLPYVAGAVGAVSLVIALRQLFYGPHISDVYLYQQGLWTTLHGHGWFYVSDEGGSHFGTHWSPALFALLPLYAAWPSAAPLVILQSAALAAAAFPAYALARRRWPEGESLALTAGLLILPSLLGSTLWQFHEAAFGLAAFLAAFAYFEARRGLRFVVFAALALLVKETFVIPVALFSIYAAAQRRGWRWVVLPAAGAAIYGALTFAVIMPHFRSEESGRPWRYLYGYLGKSPSAAARHLVAHPGRTAELLTRGRNRTYLEEISAPFGYLLPLGGWPVVFGVPEALAVLLARPSPWPIRDPTAHYSMLIASALFVSFGFAVAGLSRRLRVSRTPAALAAGLFFALAAAGGMHAVGRYTRALPPETIAARRALVSMIPPEASVVTTYAAAPYLANRREVFIEREGTLRRRRAQYYLAYGRPDTPEARTAIAALGYRLVGASGGFELWRRSGARERGAPPPAARPPRPTA